MKIVCDSCGAKYQIADDKVAPGKVFKIRCKKCSSVIVVRGDQEPEEQDEATRVFDYGGEAVWHVVVDGEQQGPFAPLQLGGLLSDGKIDPDTYVWKDGFDGWKAMREVPELASVIGTLGADAPVESADLFAAADAGEADAGDADLFGSASSSPFAGGGAKEQKAASKGAGLFASGGGGLDDDEVVASRPSPRVSADEANLTGQRNENSVLFSLSNLQALATGPAPAAASSSKASSSSSSSAGSFSAPAAAAPKQSAGFASGEASGLIDIRALASSAAAPRSAPAKSSSVDDLLSIGAGSSSLSAGALAAPALAPIVREPEPAPSGGSNKGLLVGGGIVMIAAVAAAVFFAMKPPEVVTEVREVQVGGAPTTGAAPTDPTGAAPATGTAAAPATGTTAATPATPAAPAVPARPLTPAEQAREDARQREREAARAAAAANMTTTAATPATPATPAATMTAAASGDINSLVNMALGAPVAMETEAANPNLPETPARDAVASALRSVSAQVRACGAGEHGSAPVSVVFRSSGAVSNATVGGQFAGTPVGSCVARAVRGARVPPFRNASFNVTFPYAL